MKKTSFSAYLKRKKIQLVPWQLEAATAFLQILEAQGPGAGKSFLLKTLTEFTSNHGNYFELP